MCYFSRSRLDNVRSRGRTRLKGTFPSEIAFFSPVPRGGRKIPKNPLKLFPNHALHQAEPQPGKSGALRLPWFFLHYKSMGALLTRGAACCSSRKLLRSLISDTPVGSAVVDWFEGRNAVVVCAVHDVRITSAITAPPKVRRSEYPFIDSARFKVLGRLVR
jgi:hypothetical protein